MYNVGPTSSPLVQHCTNVIQMFCVYCDFTCESNWSRVVHMLLCYIVDEDLHLVNTASYLDVNKAIARCRSFLNLQCRSFQTTLKDKKLELIRTSLSGNMFSKAFVEHFPHHAHIIQEIALQNLYLFEHDQWKYCKNYQIKLNQTRPIPYFT